MQNAASMQVRSLPDANHLRLFAHRLLTWLVDDLNRSSEPAPQFTESRARALLRASDLVDDPTRHSFERLVESEPAIRVALYDLLANSELAEDDETAALVAASAVGDVAHAPDMVAWQSLAIAAYAWKRGYPLYQLDPASPPSSNSPARQVLKRAASFMRQQVQRSATERDKLARQLAYTPTAGHPDAPSLEELQQAGSVPPLPPHFRPPIPVRYPEVARETLQVEPDEPATGASRGEPIKISEDDLPPASRDATRQEPIRITPEQLPETSAQRTRVVTPDATVAPRSPFAESVRKRFGRGREAMKTTKLRVTAQEYPDGPGLYGLQVRVTCQGIKSYVAGTTSREGLFVCELPVPEHSGLTYDVEVTWPREMDAETERKSMTLSADRTEFTLPFYRSLAKP